MKNTSETHRFDWNGILLEITYHPWLPAHIVGEDLAQCGAEAAAGAQVGHGVGVPLVGCEQLCSERMRWVRTGAP